MISKNIYLPNSIPLTRGILHAIVRLELRLVLKSGNVEASCTIVLFSSHYGFIKDIDGNGDRSFARRDSLTSNASTMQFCHNHFSVKPPSYQKVVVCNHCRYLCFPILFKAAGSDPLTSRSCLLRFDRDSKCTTDSSYIFAVSSKDSKLSRANHCMIEITFTDCVRAFFIQSRN